MCQTSGDVTAISEQLQAVTTRYLSEDGVSTDCLLLSSGRYSTVGTQHKTRDTVALICNASDSFNYGMGGEVRFSILYLYVIGTFLPVASLIGSLGRMLEQYGEESFEVRENPFCRLTSTFLMLSIRNMHLCADGTLAGVKFTAILLRAWLSLTANCVGQSFYIELVARVEDLLCLNLANSPASLALLEHESALLVERCLKTKLMNIDKSDHKPQGCLLASIVASDPLKFSPALLRSLVEKNLNNSFRHLFDRGLLDRAVCMMLDCPEFVKGHLEKVLSLSSLLNARAMKMISVSLYPNLLLDGLLSVLLAYTSHVIILKRKLPLPSVVELLTRNVDQLPAALQRVLDLEPVLTKEKLLKLTLRICLANHQDGNSSVKTLVSSLLLFLCEELPQSLRVSVDTKTSGPTNFIDPLNLISWLRDLLLGCCDYDIVSRVSLKVTSLIRVFLKIGIGTTHESNTNIRLACLELVSHYMVHLHDGSAELRPFVSSFSPSLASQVFLMVTTHSKFVSLMNSSEEDAVKLEALRILLGCLSATDDIEFDADVWSCFLASFNAGTTEIDLVLRCLLSLYARKSPKVRRSLCLTYLR